MGPGVAALHSACWDPSEQGSSDASLAGNCGGYRCLLCMLVADIGLVPMWKEQQGKEGCCRSRRKPHSLQSVLRSLCLQSRNGPLSPFKKGQRALLHF